MVNSQLGALLRHVHDLAGVADRENVTDGQLLEQFAGGDTDTAFAALVRRFAPLVLGVCRRVLHDGHAAEDAFQATFLILFRRARFLDRRGALAGWLHTVAYHVALKAKAAAARRQHCERQVVKMPPTQACVDDGWRDLQPVLDEEVNRLPDKYRTAVVLCYLEGKTNEDAARLLRLPVGTIKSRLARARDLLRTRLVRRGVTLSTGLLVTLLADRARAAVPLLLLQSTIKTVPLLAAGQVAAAPVVVLADGALQALAATRARTGALVVLVVAAVLAGLGSVTHQALAQRQADGASAPPLSASGRHEPRPARTEAQASTAARPGEPKNEETMTVTGQVRDARGQPVAGASVALTADAVVPRAAGSPSTLLRVLGQARTDPAGKFRLTAPWASSAGPFAARLFAAAPGFGVAGQALDADAEGSEVTLQLRPEQPLHIRLLDLKAQPAAGVEIRVTELRRKGPDGLIRDAARAPAGLELWPRPVTTDDQGRAVIRGLSADTVLLVRVADPRHAVQQREFVVAAAKDGRETTWALAPSQVIEGQVVHADTRKPVPQARVEVRAWVRSEAGGAYETWSSQPAIEGRADNEGRFRINPFPGGRLEVTAFAPAGAPYLTLTRTVPWPKGAVKQDVEVALPRGILVHGKVTETGSGKPVAGAAVRFQPRSPAAQRSEDYDLSAGWAVPTLTGPDGTFTMAVVSGRGHLLVKAGSADYLPVSVTAAELEGQELRGQHYQAHGLAALDLPADASSHKVAITLRRGLTRTVRFVGPDGKPIAHGTLFRDGIVPWGYTSSLRQSPVRGGLCALHGCDPDKPLSVLFLAGKEGLGAALQLTAEEGVKEPLTVRLQPCGSAVVRLVDTAGKPLRNHHPQMEMIATTTGKAAQLDWAGDLGVNALYVPRKLDQASDDQGRLTFSGLIPGATYVLAWWQDGAGLQRKTFQVESGKTIELPKITLQTEKREP